MGVGCGRPLWNQSTGPDCPFLLLLLLLVLLLAKQSMIYCFMLSFFCYFASLLL